MKYEFASRPWFAALHAIICEKARLAALADPDFSFSICEVFTDVPAALATMPGGKAAWHAVVHGSNVHFALAESDDVAFKAIAHYASVLPLGRFDTMGDPERAAQLQSMSLALVTSGRLRMVGAPPSSSANTFGSLHDSIARLTI